MIQKVQCPEVQKADLLLSSKHLILLFYFLKILLSCVPKTNNLCIQDNSIHFHLITETCILDALVKTYSEFINVSRGERGIEKPPETT